MKTVTVLTPTYNRATTLPRTYKSLMSQSDNDFTWLIIDDGSTDQTEDIVRGWIKEAKIDLEYYKIQKGGQHKALQLGFHKAKTKYLVKLDSDDAFVEDTIKIYKKAWESIALSENDDIGNIAALSMFEDGTINGNWRFRDGVDHMDSTWHEMVLKRHNHNELSNCTKTEILRAIYPSNYIFWHEDRIEIINGVFSPRISRRCKTRSLVSG
jgi:glycosyltransferase involved in cell wall biosynthesis